MEHLTGEQGFVAGMTFVLAIYLAVCLIDTSIHRLLRQKGKCHCPECTLTKLAAKGDGERC